MRHPRHIVCNSFGIYSYRKTVPKKLRPLIGKKTLKKSLGTSSQRVALRHAVIIDAIVELGFRNLMSKKFIPGIKGLTTVGLGYDDNGRLKIDSAVTDPSVDPLKEAEAFERIVSSFVAASAQVSQPTSSPLSSSPYRQTTQNLQSCLETYLREKKSGKRKVETLNRYRANLSFCLEIIGDVNPDAVAFIRHTSVRA